MRNKMLPAAAGASALALGTAVCWQGLTLSHKSLPSPKITAPVRMLLFSDLHGGFYGNHQKGLIRVVERTCPDLLLFAGDMFDDRGVSKGAEALFRHLAGDFPSFYVTGNHDFTSGRGRWIKSWLAQQGVTVLEGNGISLRLGQQRIRICGVDDPAFGGWSRQLADCAADLDPEEYTVLISHRPERVEAYQKYPFDLVVSGHCHGGQWRIPKLLKGLYAPNQGLFPTYTDGCYPLGDSGTLVVSRGLARNWVPRVFNPPQLVVLDLMPVKKGAV